jgi:eukaryotic-like serine/threonine-protein kinase
MNRFAPAPNNICSEMIGAAFNQYRITASIGAGGMGEVFRARDTRLNRDVAIKVLPKDFAADVDRLRRFEQEAKTLAALNHPNVLTIHDAGVHEGAPYLVSELLEGKTLRDEMNGAALPVRKATEYALQVAQGLAAAHGKGVIHRDLKPENLFVSRDGRVKILDFGLAKLRDPSLSLPSPSPLGEGDGVRGDTATLRVNADTLTTEPGRVLGTPAYMAPEQVRGESADHRADIFAFGCVVYEMLSGTRVFRRDTAIDTMSAIINHGPADLTVVQPDLPAALARIVHRCLEKSAERRFQSASDLAFALGNTIGTTPLLVSASGTATVPITTRSLFPWGVATLACLGLVITLVMWPGGKSARAPRDANSGDFSRKFEFVLPAKISPGHITFYPAISPDGRKLAYANSSGLWVHSLDRIKPPALLAATTNASNPFWSPDSTDIGYWEGRKVQRVPLQGGTPVLVGTAPREVSEGAGGGAWLANDRIVFASGWDGLFEAPAQGGRVVSALETRPGDGDEDFHNPSALPDARGVLFVIHRTGDRMDTIALWVSAGERKILLQLPGGDFWKPVYCRSGHVLFHRRDPSRGVWAFRFSLEKLKRTGEPFRVSETGTFPSVADDGTLAFSLEGVDVFFDSRQLIWVDREGNVLNPIGRPLPGLMTPRISPDGRRVVASAGEWWAELDLWLFDASAGGATAFAQSPDQDVDPFWWQKGRTLLWTRRLGETWSVSMRPLDGAGEEQSLLEGEAAAASDSGEFLLVRQRTADGTTTLGYVSMTDGPGTIHPVPESLRFIRNPTLSPDDQWLAYQSPEAGSTEVYLVDFPGFRLARQAVSRGGGRNPRWHPDGNSLFYLTKEGRTLMSARLKAGGPETEEPTKVFDLPESVYGGYEWLSNFYDVARDGQRFLMLQRVAVDSEPTLTAKPNVRVVLNWFEEFREKK